MVNWISRLWNRRLQEVASSAELPEELLTALSSRDFGNISPAIQKWCESFPSTENPKILLDAAREQGWPEAEANKLKILAEYYGGDVCLAFDMAKDFASSENFDPDLFLISVICLYRDNQFEEAYKFLGRIATDHPGLAKRSDYWLISGLVCWAVADMDGVSTAVRRMLELSPNDSAVLESAFGMVIELGHQGLIDELKGVFEAGRLQRGYAYSLCLLALGEREAGLRWMESRYDMQEASRYINKGLFGFPRWHGEDMPGGALLLSAEQGLGDTVQMARYLPVLLARNFGKLILETQEETISLLQYNFPEIEIVVREYAKAPLRPFDVWIGMFSLPLLVGKGAVVPGKAGYLNAPTEARGYWRARVEELSPRRRLRIGLAWSGQPRHRADRRRSVPFQKMADAVRGLDADFFALQTSVPATLPSNIINVADEMLTLSDTAALIEEMDLVISVDTSVVHLAGALGKRTWLLLPYRYEWRWGLEGESNDWYDSVLVCRQLKHGDWDELLGRVFGTMFHEVLQNRGR